MKHQDLLQKHAKALGVPEVKISYMFRMGRIKIKPETWKDLFRPEIHGFEGS